MSSTRMHIHLDVIGGIAGDMFAAAMLDAFPDLRLPLEDMLSGLTLSLNANFRLEDAMDKGLTGKRFQVVMGNSVVSDKTHLVFTPARQPSGVLAPAAHDHHHYRWQDVMQRLDRAALPDDITRCAREIYTLLAQAECAVHNTSLEQLHLHEVGAADALIDIVSAAFLIHHSQVTSWSVSSLPWGGGMTRCAHGKIPVPAPATLNLLDGFSWFDDGQPGERITPTGAAILAWLKPRFAPVHGSSSATGYGFGNRQFAQCANVLRVCVFTQRAAILQRESIIAVQCDIDDMTPELLAIAIDQLRQHDAVIDLTTYAGQGKKQRWVTHLEILCRAPQLDDVCQAIFNQTSTLGVRFHPVTRYTLPRRHDVIAHEQQEWPVKYARRPNGEESCKVEADSLCLSSQSHHQRQYIKATIENHLVSK